ncbi:MAG TPA: hypothetical protein VMP08_05415 [Anaerolineae bacterium]|nr:hypothetical protein [Anaerolineae bacterium]
MNVPALYAIVVGLLIFAQWAFFLITRQVPELKPSGCACCFTSPVSF